MPRVDEVGPGVVAELAQQAQIGLERCGNSAEDDPKTVVTAINDRVTALRDSGEPPQRDDALALGVLLGEQYVRAFGWRWVSLAYPDGADAFAVVDPDDSVGSQTMNWVYSTLFDGQEITFLLSFNMIEAGQFPRGAAGDPIMLA